LSLAVDLIAERIRALGHFAPGSYADYAKLTAIAEANGVPKAEEMLAQLVDGHEILCRTARSIFPLADRAADEPTADLLTQRLQVHEKPPGCCAACWTNKPSTSAERRAMRGVFLASSAMLNCCRPMEAAVHP
jgi:hypothetical protein